MSNRIHALAQQLTGKATLEECDINEVRQIAQRYPYFAPAQFLFLQKLKQIDSPETESQYKKAVLFYHDPLLFEYFISSDKFYIDEFVFSQPTHKASLAGADSEIINQIPVETETIQPATSDYPVENEEKIEFADALFEKTAPQVTSADEKNLYDGGDSNANQEIADNEQQIEKFVNEETEESAVETIAEKKGLPSWKNEEAKEDTALSELTFEPYHTVDYFASQGIKISQEELPKDKLGKQLKSFTEWLKTMKRLPAVQMEVVENSAEEKVENMATHSVTESDVVTEAMAEVWTKQGNREKALDIYNKLSLLNPSKNAYFAAKIENLKQS